MNGFGSQSGSRKPWDSYENSQVVLDFWEHIFVPTITYVYIYQYLHCKVTCVGTYFPGGIWAPLEWVQGPIQNLPRVSPGDVSWIVRYVPLCRLSNHERRRDDHPARHSPFDPDGRQPGWRKAGMGHTIRGKLIYVCFFNRLIYMLYIFVIF